MLTNFAKRIVSQGLRLLAGCLLLASAAEAAPGAAGDQWAILIACEKYEKAPPLRYTGNDVAQLGQTLRDRGGFKATHIYEMTDVAGSTETRPTKANLEKLLPELFKKAKPGDRVILYFSGHGFKDADGKMYLAPIDVDPKQPAKTGIAAEWLRTQLNACQAEFKLLVLDSCHAGSEKGEEDSTGVAAKDLGEPFREMTGVMTLASSTGDQKSQLWNDKQQSLFSYWLNQGMKGHADENGDGQIDVDELNKYVYRNVTETAKARFALQQTPVRIIRAAAGVPVVMKIEPTTLKQLLADVADQLAWPLEERKLKKVGVLEFTEDTLSGEMLRTEYGVLGRYCAKELENRLTQISGAKFAVVNGRRVQEALRQQQLTVAQLGSPEALQKLSTQAGGMPVVALGTLRSRNGRAVALQCQLLLADQDNAMAGSAGGTFYLSESEWAMLGRSAVVKLEDRPAPIPGQKQEDRVIAMLDQQAQSGAQLKGPGVPFSVKIMVNGKERPMRQKGNDLYVTLKKGETFAVEVENRSGEIALMKMLVDGLNTLPQKPDETKGISVFEVAPRVHIDDARHWVCDPRRGARFTVGGFVTETGAQGKLLQFTVVDSSAGMAARKNFTDQIGIITVAMFANKGARAVAIDGGNELTVDLTEHKGTVCGALLGVLNIRYGEE